MFAQFDSALLLDWDMLCNGLTKLLKVRNKFMGECFAKDLLDNLRAW